MKAMVWDIGWISEWELRLGLFVWAWLIIRLATAVWRVAYTHIMCLFVYVHANAGGRIPKRKLGIKRLFVPE